MIQERAGENLKEPLPDDVVIHAHELCPHIWQMIEDAGVFGYFNASAAKRQISSCPVCANNIIDLLANGLENVDLPYTVKFMLTQLIERARDTFKPERASDPH